MITKLSRLKKASFIEETFEEFAERNSINTEILLPAYYKNNDDYFSDVSIEAEAYFDLIPKTYKKQFPAKKEYKHLYETYLEGEGKENQKIITERFENLFAEIRAAVEKDREEWAKTPSLPGLSNKGRKPGSKNKEKVVEQTEVLPVEKINTLAQNLSGASHKDMEEILNSVFPVTEEEIDAYWNEGTQDTTKTVDILLAIMYRADIEVAAKEGDIDLVKYLLTETEKDRLLGQKDIEALERKSETIHEPKKYENEPEFLEDPDLTEYFRNRL